MAVEQFTGHDLFQLLRPDQVATIADAAEEIACAAGDTVYRRGEKADFLFVVLDGQVSLRMPRTDGVSLEIGEAIRGEMFGYGAYLRLDTYTLTTQCVTDSMLLRIRADALKKLLDDDPVMGYAIQASVSRLYYTRYLETMNKLQAIVQSMPLQTP